MRRATGGLAVAAIVAALVLGFVIAGVSFTKESSLIDSRSALQHVEIGFPMAAISQDQSRFSPPTFPARMGFDSPLESPTKVEVGGLLVDAGAAAAAVLVVTLALAAAILQSASAVSPRFKGRTGVLSY